MAYATGVASSPDDFITQLCAFAVANAGFADQGTVTSSSGTGSRVVRRISKGGIWWNFLRFSDSKGINAAMGYSGLAAGTTLPSNPIGADKQTYWTLMGTWDFTGPYVGHYFFTDGTCVHAVLEIAAGIFNHISFGKITPYGSFAYGEYVTAGYYQVYKPSNVWQDWSSGYCTRAFNDGAQGQVGNVYSYIRIANAGVAADFNALASPYHTSHGMFAGVNDDGNYLKGSLYVRLLRDAHNETTNRTPIFPGLVRLRDSVSGLYQVGGVVPYVGILKMPPDMNPKDIVNTDWQVFPITMRTGGNTSLAAISYEYALAYRRIA